MTTKRILLFVMIGAMGILQFHNLLAFLLSRGFDAFAHLEYINYLHKYHTIPLPYEGWELYQPPLYYFLAALINPSLSVKILGGLSWVSLLIATFILYKKRFRDTDLALLGSFFTGAVPVIIYLTPTLSNEFFSSVLIGISMTYYVLKKSKPDLKFYFVLGVLLGLSILAKSTAFVLLGVIIIDLLLDNWKLPIRKKIQIFGIVFFTTIGIGGWFYARNIIIFNNPFISSFNFPQYHPLTQTITPRNLHFFTDISAFFKLDLFTSHFYSFIPGTFFSWFYDGHNIIVPVQEFSKIGIILFLFSFPLLMACIGGYITELKIFSSKNRVFILYPFLLFIGYILYNFRLPYYSTVKGVFLASAVIPYGYFLVSFFSRFKKYINIIYIFAVIYCLLIIKTFWI